jgi:hypothetical protein
MLLMYSSIIFIFRIFKLLNIPYTSEYRCFWLIRVSLYLIPY